MTSTDARYRKAARERELGASQAIFLFNMQVSSGFVSERELYPIYEQHPDEAVSRELLVQLEAIVLATTSLAVRQEGKVRSCFFVCPVG